MHAAIHWAAAALGVTGALLVALQRPVVGFAIWVPSNILWIIWAATERDLPTGLMFAVYLGVTLLGLWRWRGRRAVPLAEDPESP